MMSMKSQFRSTLAFVALCILSSGALAQNYPTKPVRFIVPIVSERAQSARPLSRNSPTARSDFSSPARPMPSRMRGVFVNWMSR